jgi:predicted site-specific integrase-resolvase
MQVIKTASAIGSGLHGKRPRLLKLLTDPKVTTIVVEHRNRLARFGSDYIEAALAASGRILQVVSVIKDLRQLWQRHCSVAAVSAGMAVPALRRAP